MKVLKKILKEANSSVSLILDKHFGDEENELDIPDAVILGFFEDMVKKVESLILLIEQNQSASIDSITRSIMENHVYLKLLLSKDSELYARSYMAAKRLKDMVLYKKIITPGRNGNILRELLGKPSSEEIVKETKVADPDKEIEKIKEQFSDVYTLRTQKQSWYNLGGKTKNFEQLCIKLNMQAEYDLMYRLLSKEVHSMDVLKRWRFEKNQVQILYGPQNSEMHISMISTFLLSTMDELYDFYGLKKELRKFRTLLAVSYKYIKN